MKLSWFNKIGLIFLLLPVLSIVPPSQTSAYSPLDQACNSSGSASPACKDKNNTADPVSGPTGIIHKAANLIAIIAGIGAVVMIVLGGFYMVTSNGNADAVAKAKSRMLSGIIGLVVVVVAWEIIGLIIDKVIR